MRHSSFRRWPAFMAGSTALLAALLAPAARASAARNGKPVAVAAAPAVQARIATSCEPLAGEAPDQLPVLRSAVRLNYSNEMLEQAEDDSVEVCVLVDSTGTVREAGVSRPAAPFDQAALEAVRWWVFTPARRAGRAVPARIAVTVTARVPRDTNPLVPDVVALAQEAEARGDLRAAIDAWTGVLARTGAHPALQNEWIPREHVVRLAAQGPRPPEVPFATVSRARGQRNLMQRNIARGSNEDYARALDEVLRTAPWYADAYRWRAAAGAASGRRDGAVRDLLCYRLAAPDSAARAVAERALVFMAAGDTLRANSLLKN